MDFKSEFIGYSLDTSDMSDYGDKKTLQRHNRAITAVLKLVDAYKADEEFLVEQLDSLLQHENEKVRFTAASVCYELSLNKKHAKKVLRAIKWKSSDKTRAFLASMTLSGRL